MSTGVSIVGAGLSRFGRQPERHRPRARPSQAIDAALRDAGLEWTDVQVAFGGSDGAGPRRHPGRRPRPDRDPVHQRQERLRDRRQRADVGGATRSGPARPRSPSPSGFDKHPRGAFDPRPEDWGLPAAYGEAGLMVTTQFFGIKIPRYLREHGISERTLALVAEKAYRNGALNPNAWRREPMSGRRDRRRGHGQRPADPATCSARPARAAPRSSWPATPWPPALGGAPVHAARRGRPHPALRLLRGVQPVDPGHRRAVQRQRRRRGRRLRGGRRRPRRRRRRPAAGHRERRRGHAPGRVRLLRGRRAGGADRRRARPRSAAGCRSTPTAAASPTASRSAPPACARSTRSSPSCAARPATARSPAPADRLHPRLRRARASAPARCWRSEETTMTSHPIPTSTSSPPTRGSGCRRSPSRAPPAQWGVGPDSVAVFENWTAERGARARPTGSAPTSRRSTTPAGARSPGRRSTAAATCPRRTRWRSGRRRTPSTCRAAPRCSRSPSSSSPRPIAQWGTDEQRRALRAARCCAPT